MTSYGIGMTQDREYVVYIDGQAVASYPALTSALAHVDAHRGREAGFEEGTIALETITKFNKRREQGGGA
jgi:hypothetical protein